MPVSYYFLSLVPNKNLLLKISEVYSQSCLKSTFGIYLFWCISHCLCYFSCQEFLLFAPPPLFIHSYVLGSDLLIDFFPGTNWRLLTCQSIYETSPYFSSPPCVRWNSLGWPCTYPLPPWWSNTWKHCFTMFAVTGQSVVLCTWSIFSDFFLRMILMTLVIALFSCNYFTPLTPSLLLYGQLHLAKRSVSLL